MSGRFNVGGYKPKIYRKTVDERILLAHDKYKFTFCQGNALVEIADWYFDEDALTWTLSGPAGTGKTFLENVIKEIFYGIPLCISATTHKACRVSEKFTGIKAETMHKILGLRPNYNEDFDIRNPQFDPKNLPTINNYSFLIEDEASMIAAGMFDFLLTAIATSKTKTLFVGDEYQLPPVNKSEFERISKVFTDTSGVSRLRTPVRQSMDDPQYILLSALRSDISGNDEDYQILLDVCDINYNKQIVDIVNNDKNRGGMLGAIIKNVKQMTTESGKGFLISSDKDAYIDEVVKAFDSDEFRADTSHCRYLSYTNDSVVSWNTFIRDQLMATDDALARGDLIMGYSNVYDSTNTLLISNSSEYIVKELFEDESVVTVLEDGLPVDKIIYYYYAELVDTYDPLAVTIRVNILRPPYDGFITAHKYFHDRAKQSGTWTPYNNFKSRYLIFGDISTHSRGNILPRKDLDFNYGITVHKAQGTTIRKVYANGMDIVSHSAIAKDRARREGKLTAALAKEIDIVTLKLMYVASSRAKDFLNIFYQY